MKPTIVFQRPRLFSLLTFLYLCFATLGFSNNRLSARNVPVKDPLIPAGVSLNAQALKGTIQDGNTKSLRPKQSKLVLEFKEVRRSVVSFLKRNDFRGAKKLIEGMFEYVQEDENLSGNEKLQVCEAVDETLQLFYRSAFAPKGRPSEQRVLAGFDLLHLQLSSNILVRPYDTAPKQTLLSALKALTRLKEVRPMDSSQRRMGNADCAYRILQRLVTGVGVRMANPRTMRIYESDFNMVLNAYSNVGRMDMAHRVVALQERTPHAPVLSPVAYSILLKGYGRLGDLNNVEMLLTNAKASKIEPDLIMVNSLLDAYINSNEWQKAKEIFECLRTPSDRGNFESQYESLFYVKDNNIVTPNKRTYNIMMKGFAARGLLKESLELASEMERLDLWDHVTTNTLVHAAVNAKEFNVMEQILERHTEQTSDYRGGRHPNADAYTSAIDGYAKSDELQNAIDLLKTMKNRGVEPNEFTYTCLVGALARKKKTAQAEKMIDIMKSSGLKVGVITYNSLMSGLVDRGDSKVDEDDFNGYVDAAINVLRKMMREGIRPTAVTISILVDAFGKCAEPRLAEAKALVTKLESDGVIRARNTRVLTALVQVYGASGDLEGAEKAFNTIKKPDIAAVNNFLNACTHCDEDSVAKDVFDKYFRSPSSGLRPDVISYSIMISKQLMTSSSGALRRARNLYEEMKIQRRLSPDKALVDIILKAMIENGKRGGLTAGDVRFVAGVLRDAEKLSWRDGQLESRKGAVRTVMTGRIADLWEEEAGLFGLDDPGSNEMFKRHGWNKVDSGFQLWGARIAEPSPTQRSRPDEFLESKGWNNVESGFRII